MYNCAVCNSEMPDWEPNICCNGYLCGCMGLPTELQVCSEICYDIYMSHNHDTKYRYLANAVHLYDCTIGTDDLIGQHTKECIDSIIELYDKLIDTYLKKMNMTIDTFKEKVTKEINDNGMILYNADKPILIINNPKYEYSDQSGKVEVTVNYKELY